MVLPNPPPPLLKVTVFLSFADTDADAGYDTPE